MFSEDEFLKRMPKAPEWLPEGALEFRKKYGPHLIQTGRTTAVDWINLDMLCHQMHLYSEAAKELESKGLTNKHDQVSAHFTAMQNSAKQIQALSKEFGLTIASRSRLSKNEKSDPGQEQMAFPPAPGQEQKLKKVD